MHSLMLLYSQRWLCALSVSARGRISELMLSKASTLQGNVLNGAHSVIAVPIVDGTLRRSYQRQLPTSTTLTSRQSAPTVNQLHSVESANGEILVEDGLVSYDTRSGLLDHLNSDRFGHWSDRRLRFPRGFFHCRAFGLGLCNSSFRSLGYLARLAASCRCFSLLCF
jgi:hypothetical protein